jgi:hypothetical protein
MGEVIDTDAENLRITFVDESRDDIHPAQVSPVRSTLSPSSAMNSPESCDSSPWKVGARFYSRIRLRQYHRICALFVNESFETQQWKVAPWKKCSRMRVKATSQLRRPPSQKALSVVFQLTFFPDTIAPWILISGDTVIDESMRLWESLACRELLKCFVNELFAAEIKKVGLSGKPPRKIPFGEEHAALPLTSFRKQQNGFFWKETKPSLNIPFVQ